MAHTIVNATNTTLTPNLVPHVHTSDTRLPDEVHAFCLHIGNIGLVTADDVVVQIRYTGASRLTLNEDGWTSGPSHTPGVFRSTQSINPDQDSVVIQVRFQESLEEFVFEFCIWARNYLSTEHRIEFTRGESVPRDGQGNRIVKYG